MKIPDLYATTYELIGKGASQDVGLRLKVNTVLVGIADFRRFDSFCNHSRKIQWLTKVTKLQFQFLCYVVWTFDRPRRICPVT